MSVPVNSIYVKARYGSGILKRNRLDCMDLNSADAEFIRVCTHRRRGREGGGFARRHSLSRNLREARTSRFPVIFIDIHEHLCNARNGGPHFLLSFAVNNARSRAGTIRGLKSCLSRGFIANRGLAVISETKPRLFMCCQNLLAYISTMEKARALHKSSRYILRTSILRTRIKPYLL